MNVNDEITRVLERAAIDGALDRNAATRWKETLDSFDEAMSEIERLRGDLNKSRKDREDVSTLASNLAHDIEAWKKREAELIEREQKMLELELLARHHEQRVIDHQKMFGQVFRNLETRRTVFTPVPGTPNTVDQYGNTSYGVAPFVQQDTQAESVE